MKNSRQSLVQLGYFLYYEPILKGQILKIYSQAWQSLFNLPE